MKQNCLAQPPKELTLKPIPQVNCSDNTACVGKPALRELFDAEESSLLRYAYSLAGRRSVAEEIVQEVFLQLHARWDEVDSPRAWLYRSVRNRAFNHKRDHKREILSYDQYQTYETQSSDASPDAVLSSSEAVGMLRVMLEELSDVDRQLVKLKYFENLKYREISERTGLSISNVGYRLHHVLKELAQKLRQLGIDGLS